MSPRRASKPTLRAHSRPTAHLHYYPSRSAKLQSRETTHFMRPKRRPNSDAYTSARHGSHIHAPLVPAPLEPASGCGASPPRLRAISAACARSVAFRSGTVALAMRRGEVAIGEVSNGARRPLLCRLAYEQHAVNAIIRATLSHDQHSARLP
eukprot:7010842-Prymnesium_polylepis.1